MKSAFERQLGAKRSAVQQRRGASGAVPARGLQTRTTMIHDSVHSSPRKSATECRVKPLRWSAVVLSKEVSLLAPLVNVRATAQERQRALPGDTLLPDAATVVMHAVTIAAPVDRVWPWLVQMGAGRAGWYSYDWVDNGRRPSAVTILPELQHLTAGNVMPSLPGAKDSFVVAVVEAERDLVLTVPAASGGLLVSWEFFLEPLTRWTTRLLVRGRLSSNWPSGGPEPTSFSPRLIERVYALLAGAPRWLVAPAAKFGHGVMQARQLRGIKQRAEASIGSENVSNCPYTGIGSPTPRGAE